MPGGIVYFDASALVKLLLEEPQSSALRAFVAAHLNQVTSLVSGVEVPRAVLRSGSRMATGDRIAMDRVTRIALTPTILRRAATLYPPTLRSLDAIHLATALELGADLDILVTYDARLAAAAAANGIRVAAPA